MDAETKRATVGNPRWWIVLPIMLPLAAGILLAGLFAKPLWWIGQSICKLSNAISPFNHATPRLIKRLIDWARANIQEPPHA